MLNRARIAVLVSGGGTPIQQRRIHMLMENMTIREIARQEGCHMNAALKSVNGALKKLHDLLKDWA